MKKNIIQLVIDTLKLYSGQFSGLIISLATTVIVARILGPEGRGIYSWIFTIAVVGSQFATLGLDAVNRRFAAEQPDKIPEFTGNSIVAAIFTLVTIVPLLFIISYQFDIGHNHPWSLLIALCSIPFATLSLTLASILTPMGRINATAMLQIVSKSVTAATIVLLLILGLISIFSVTLATSLGSVAMLGLTTYALRDVIKKGLKTSLPLFKNTLYYAASGYTVGVCFFIASKFDIIFLGIASNETAVGFYSVSKTLIDIMIMVPGTLGFIILSKISAMGNRTEKLAFASIIIKWTFFIMIIGALLASVIAPPLIPIVFGDSFNQSIKPFQYLLIAVPFISIYAVLISIITALSSAKKIVPAPIAMLVSNVIICIVLIPTMHISGAIYAFITSSAIGATIVYYQFLQLKKEG